MRAAPILLRRVVGLDKLFGFAFERLQDGLYLVATLTQVHESSIAGCEFSHPFPMDDKRNTIETQSRKVELATTRNRFETSVRSQPYVFRTDIEQWMKKLERTVRALEVAIELIAGMATVNQVIYIIGTAPTPRLKVIDR